MSSTRRLPAPLLGVVVLTACTTPGGEGDPGGEGGPDPDAPWRTSTAPVDPGGFVWLAGSTVHLGDGSTVELAEPTDTYVVAGDGVFSTADSDEVGAPVLFTAPGAASVGTGLVVRSESLQASDDGRYLAAVDVAASEESDQFGTTVATTLVLDLETGEEVVRSTEGMGDTGSDDLADLYSESEIGPLAFVGDAVVVRTAEGELAFDLATGEARAPAAGEAMPSAPTSGSEEALTSPDGRWRIAQGRELADVIEPVTGGREVVPDTGSDRWALQFWSDDTTAVGSAVDGPGSPRRIVPADSETLLTCVVPSGRCTRYEESTNQDVTFPLEAGTSAVGLGLSGVVS